MAAGPDPREEIARIVAEAEPIPMLVLVETEPRASVPIEEEKPLRKRGASKGSARVRGLRAHAENNGEGGAPPVDGGIPPLEEPSDLPPDAIELCAAEPLNDTGNGKRLLHHFGQDILHVREIGWHLWHERRTPGPHGDVVTEGHWEREGGDEAVTRYAQVTAARIALERSYLTFSKSEQASVEAGELAEIELKALGTSILERSEEDTKAEQLRLASIIAEGRAAKKVLSGRKTARAKFAVGSGNQSRINGMIAQALPHRTVPPEALDRDPLAFNVQNGTLRFSHVKDDECPDETVVRLKWEVRLDPHNRDDLFAKLAPVAYDPAAKAPIFLGLVERFQPNIAIRQFLQSYHGIALTGRSGGQIFVFYWGAGANFKSSFIECICRLMGAYAQMLNYESLTGSGQRRGDQATPDFARLPGSRLLRVSELPELEPLKEALVKSLTGGEPLLARHLNKGFFEFRPVFKAMLSGNAKPQIRDISPGMWRRVRLVPWPVVMPEEERKDFEEMQTLYTAEWPGILNWLIEGTLSYLTAGRLQAPAEVMEATEEYREEMDPVGRFLAVCVFSSPPDDFTGERKRIGAKKLHDYYIAWAEETGAPLIKSTGFGRILKKKGMAKEEGRLNFYLDIELHPDAPVPRSPPTGLIR